MKLRKPLNIKAVTARGKLRLNFVLCKHVKINSH